MPLALTLFDYTPEALNSGNPPLLPVGILPTFLISGIVVEV